MKKRLLTVLLATTVACTVFAGCGLRRNSNSTRSVNNRANSIDYDDDDDDDDYDYDGTLIKYFVFASE